MIAFRSLTRSAAFAAVLALVACGGGGGGGTTTVPSAHPTTTAAPAGPMAQVTLRIDTSNLTTTSSSARTPRFISPSTQSITVALQGGAVIGSLNIAQTPTACVNGTCMLTISAPVGSDTFVITTWDGLNGTGNQLSSATTVATVVANTTNTISVALGGIVTSATVILGSSSVQAGTAATVAVTVAAYDAHQNLIIGPGNYSSPVTLTNSDTSGVTHLSAAQITGPGATVNLVYNGGSTGGATITPFIGSTAGTAATFTPTGYGFADFTLSAPTGYISAIAAGPDGNTWFTASTEIGYVTPAGTQTTVASNLPTQYIYGLATAPNGVIWFGDDAQDLATISTNGIINYLTSINVLPNTNNCGGGNDNDFDVARRRAQGGTPAAVTCGSVNWMAPGPDGNLWFSDDNGFIGNITPAGVATEWDISQLNFTGSYFPEPEQFTFGADGNIYAADADNLVDQIIISGGVPTSATALSTSCDYGAYGVAIDASNTLWTGDDCSNLYAVPLGTPIGPSNFNQSNLQSWSINQISAGDSFGYFARTAAGVFTIDYASTSVYRINEISGTTPPQPAITTFTQFTSGFAGEALTIGPDSNLWVGFTGNDEGAQGIARVSFGAPAIGTQSLLRNFPRATTALGRNAGLLAARRPHRPRRPRGL